MTKKTITILASLMILAISFILLLIFFVFNGHYFKNNTKDKFTLSVDNITLNIGDIVYNYFDVSEDNAQITISTNNNNVIEINKDYIKGLEVGNVTVTIIAEFNGINVKKSFQVTVKTEDYSYNIIPVLNCSYKDNNIYIFSNICQFRIEILDVYGKLLENITYQINSTNDSIFYMELSNFILISNSDCSITIYIPEIERTFIVNCYINI